MEPSVVNRRSMRAWLLALPAGLLLVAAIVAGPRWTMAQNATPSGSRTITCSVESGTPVGSPEATPAGTPAMAASPAAEFTPTPAGSEAVSGLTTSVRTIAECANSGNFAAVVALMTDNFIRDHLGASSRADAESRLSALQRMTIRLMQTPETYDDGTASIIVVYVGFLNETGSPVAERWYFVVEDGVYKLDRIEPAELPPGIS
jgi:hypothetical protein